MLLTGWRQQWSPRAGVSAGMKNGLSGSNWWAIKPHPPKKYYCFIVPHVVRGLDFTARVRGAIDNREEFCRFPPPSRKSGGAGPSPIPRTISSVAFFHPIHLIVQQVYQFRYMLNVAELVDHLQAPFNPLVAHLSPRHQ